MPEERNRIVADHLSDLLLAPTPTAMANLDREGLADRAELVGDVMVDAHGWASARARGSHLPAAARDAAAYVLLTLHRPTNVDDPARLGQDPGGGSPLGLPVVFPVHPRTRAVLDRAGVALPPNVVTLMEPVGYLEMVALERGARAIATDSGGVQKEAYLAGVPCITLRSETEWVETVEAGWNRLADAEPVRPRPGPADEAFMPRDRPRRRPVRRRRMPPGGSWRRSSDSTTCAAGARTAGGGGLVIPIAQPQMGAEEQAARRRDAGVRLAGPGPARSRARGAVRGPASACRTPSPPARGRRRSTSRCSATASVRATR